MAEHPSATVRIHSVGDPVLWDGLPEAMAIARRNQVRSWIFTSAITPDKAVLDALIECASVVEVSVNSATREDYLATKGVDGFALVTANVERMSRNRNPGPAARLIVSRTQSGDPAADSEFVRFWQASGLVDDAFVRSFHSYNGLLSGGSCAAGDPKHEPCLVHWARFNIGVEGKAVVCFNELFRERLDPALVLGDVRQERIADIWRGPALTALRQAELTGHYGDLPFAAALPCPHCTACQPLFGHGQTSEHQIQKLPPLRPLRP
jgi:MoaA/NifB/PqqE/SkfB family radical SAM enzyme